MPMLLAGLYDSWGFHSTGFVPIKILAVLTIDLKHLFVEEGDDDDPKRERLYSCTVITTDASPRTVNAAPLLNICRFSHFSNTGMAARPTPGDFGTRGFVDLAGWF
jgi:hypothetical protein